MAERLILTVVLLALSGLAFTVLQVVQRRYATAELAASQSTSQTAAQEAVQPSILYFRSDTCAPCVTQKRFLEELAAKQDVRIETIDVLREPERASAFNVLTLPTTIVVGEGGQVKEINYGLTDAAKLARQLA